MLFTILSIISLYRYCHAVLTDWDCHKDDQWLDENMYIAQSSDYWIAGIQSEYRPFQSAFKWDYCRPNEPNTDFSYKTNWYHSYPSNPIPQQDWQISCHNPDEVLSSIQSTDNNYVGKCEALQPQFKLIQCGWSGYLTNSILDAFDYKCSNGHGAMRHIRTKYVPLLDDGGRLFDIACCKIEYIPMDVSTGYDSSSYPLVIGIKSDYSNNQRTTNSFKWGKPNWFTDDDGNLIQSTYDLTDTNPAVHFWTRLCPTNGALTKFTDQGDGRFSFECGTFNNKVKIDACQWTYDINEFHTGFEAMCDEDGPIRGIQAYYSALSDDRKFKLYCCTLSRATYSKDHNIRIGTKTYNDNSAKSDGVITLDLCWNNNKYQGIVIMNAYNQQFWVDDIVKYDVCGSNEREITVSIYDSDGVWVSEIQVEDDGTQYIISSFCESGVEGCTDYINVKLHSNYMSDVVYKFPDDYLIACTAAFEGCQVDVTSLKNFQQYLMTIEPCGSYNIGSGTPQIGIVLRGIDGNLDKTILSGPTFDELTVGSGNIGELIHINIEYESGPDFCIQEVRIQDPWLGVKYYGRDYFADGIILSGDCGNDGDFRRLTGIQYVACYDTPFSITTYETSLYSSVQIHTCSGSDAGITAANSGLLTMTVTGLSKNEKFISTEPYSLTSSTNWNSGNSRDFTFGIALDLKKISIVSITNNDEDDVLCIDSVLINGVDAFLTHYWVGLTSNHNAIQTIPAVLEWPICDIELTTTIESEAPILTDPDTVATSTCVNRNRLMSVDCQISQTFETYEEISWTQETGAEVTRDIAIERGTDTSLAAGFTISTSAGIEAGTDTFKVSTEMSYSASVEASRTWSSSTTVSEGKTIIDTTTDGTINGKTVGIECSGSVNVPPSQQVEYTMLIDRTVAKIITKTDMKLTKCSAYLYGADYHDPNNYIYVYGIEGELTVSDATNCYVSFEQSTFVGLDAESINCGKERVLATREWGTYVPLCDAEDPAKYDKCQCAYGDSLTLPTCGCVDETTGNLLDTAQATVVQETVEYKWLDWCQENCYPLEPVSAQTVVEQITDKITDPVTDSYNKSIKSSDYMLEIVAGLVLTALFVVIYLINSCISWYKQCIKITNDNRTMVNKYERVKQILTESEVDIPDHVV